MISPKISVAGYFRLDLDDMTYKIRIFGDFNLRPPPILKLIFEKEKYEQNEGGENVLPGKLANGKYIQRVYWFLGPCSLSRASI